MKRRALLKSKDKEVEYIDGVRVPKAKEVNRATPARTLAKTISWRILASLTTFLIFYVSTGQKVAAAIIGASVGLEFFAKIGLYYLHERLWENVDWGKIWLRYGLVRRIKLYYIRRRRRKKGLNNSNL